MKKYITQIVGILVSSGVIAALNFGLVEWLNSIAAVIIDQSLTPHEQKIAIGTLTIGALVSLGKNVAALLSKWIYDAYNPA